ncbi:MAG: acetyl-CoA acetyltransferase [Acidimicrobiales bacterium]
MALDPRTPVLAGVGQVVMHPEPGIPVASRPEPVELMTRALELAAIDCGSGNVGWQLIAQAKTLRVMNPLGWSYKNPGLIVAQRLGIEPPELALSTTGGNGPQLAVNEMALAIASGSVDVALLVGADCIYTRTVAERDPGRPVLPWTVQPDSTPVPVMFGTDREPVTAVELAHGLDKPLKVFPIMENALRRAAGEDMKSHQMKIAQMWSRFSEIAATNRYAWSPEVRSAEEILTVGPANRMTAFPYPKLMVANDRVDQAAALVLCSYGAARSAGVPAANMVFPIAGADANDHWYLSHRENLHSSPAIRLAGRTALGLAGRGIDDVSHVDLYSCFPCAVQIAAAEIGLPIDDPARPLTVTGGLTFAGDPGNNYVTHSIATMARRLRGEPGALGLITGLGWYATKHSIGLWSSEPPPGGFRWESPQDQVDALPQRAPATELNIDVTVESYTVTYSREGAPEEGILALLTSDGKRAWGNVTDHESLESLTAEEGYGRSARLRSDGMVDLR